MATYGKPFAGICVATAVFLCGLTGYPVPPEVLPTATGTFETGVSSTVAAGGSVELSGGGFLPGSAVSIALYSSPQLLSEVVADEAGRIYATVTVPTETPSGGHTISAVGLSATDEPHAIQVAVTIVEPDALPFTGGRLLVSMAGGLGLILAGFVLIRSAAFRRPLFHRSST